MLGTADGRTAYGMCGTAEPGTRPTSSASSAAAPHSWRAIATVTFDGDEVPRRERASAGAGESSCEDAGRGVAEDALDFQWGYEWPTEEQWDDGQTYGSAGCPTGAQKPSLRSWRGSRCQSLAILTCRSR